MSFVLFLAKRSLAAFSGRQATMSLLGSVEALN